MSDNTSASSGTVFATLEPVNVLAKLAFDAAAEHSLSQDANPLHRRFMSVEVEKKYDHEVSLYSRRCRSNQDPEDALSDTATDFDTETEQDANRVGMIWTGRYQFDIQIVPENGQRGWVAGRSPVEFFVPTRIIGCPPISGIRERHVLFNINTITGHLYLLSRASNNGPSQVSVNGYNVARGSKHALNQCRMNIRLGPLQYVFDYAPFAYTQRYKNMRQKYVIDHLQMEVGLDLEPTPQGDPWMFGSWTVGESLGRGAAGKVYRATDIRGQCAVIKFIEKHPARARSIDKEIKTLQALTKLGKEEDDEGRLLHLQDIIRHNEHASSRWEDVALILHPVAEQTLQTLIEVERPCKEISSRPMKLFLEALKGVNFLHSHRWLHRDLKPANIGIIGSRAILLDIDSSVCLEPGKLVKATPGCSGTVGYLAPEREMQDYGLGADVWAMGIIGFQLAYGYHPWALNMNPWRPGARFEAERPTFESKYEVAMQWLQENAEFPVCVLLIDMLKYQWAKVNKGDRTSIFEVMEHFCWTEIADSPKQKRVRR